MMSATLTMMLAAVEAELAFRSGRRGRADLERRHGFWAVVVATIGAANAFRHLAATWIFG